MPLLLFSSSNATNCGPASTKVESLYTTYTMSVYYISQQLVNSINSQYKNNKIHREIVEKFKSFCRYEL